MFLIGYKSSDEVVRILIVVALKKDQWFNEKKLSNSASIPL